MYLIALSIRFWKTCRSRAGSHSNTGIGVSVISRICRSRRSLSNTPPTSVISFVSSTGSGAWRRVLIRDSSSSSEIKSVSTSTFFWIRSSRWMMSSSNLARCFIRSIVAMPEMFRSGAFRSCETARRKSSFSAISLLSRWLAASS